MPAPSPDVLTLNSGEPIVRAPELSLSANREKGRETLRELVMAWARDRSSGEPRYIGELTRDQRGYRSNCECWSCGLPLQAVNPGRTTCIRRPHFRHPKGAESHACVVLAARMAALEALRTSGVLELPRRRRSGQATGLSGTLYEAWVEAPPARVQVRDFEFCDKATGILTLDDGRQVRVELVGSLRVEVEGGAQILTPTIELAIPDGHLAGMSPEELRQRIQLLVADGAWCGHWQDAALSAAAEEAARLEARSCLDWADDDLGLPADAPALLKWESLLHIKAKEVLEQAGQLALPPLLIDQPSRDPRILRPSQIVGLESVELERKLAGTRPDVQVVTKDAPNWSATRLLIEITVTNGISEERAHRIAGLGLPALEIDISRMGGRLSEAEFAKLILEETAGKRWIHHPALLEEQASEPLAEIGPIINPSLGFSAANPGWHQEDWLEDRTQLMRTPCATWVRQFRENALALGSARQLDPEDPRSIDGEALALTQLIQSAKGLAAYGFASALDPDLYDGPVRILDRLLSIQLDRAVGYRMNSAWQVINTILNDQPLAQVWHTLFFLAIRIYGPTLTYEQAQTIKRRRKDIVDSLCSGDDRYRRNRKFDKLLGLLFPEMAEELLKELPGPKRVLEQGAASTVDVARDPDPWLKGADYAEWKRRYPESARDWEESKAYRRGKN